MISDPKFDRAIEAVRAIAELLTGPEGGARLRLLRAEIQSYMDWQDRNQPEPGQLENAAERGTCPTCGKTYKFKGEEGGIRRHGQGKCYTDTQMAREIIPAVLLIAELGDRDDGGNDDGRTLD